MLQKMVDAWAPIGVHMEAESKEVEGSRRRLQVEEVERKTDEHAWSATNI
jgi:hypothetical protein